MSRLIFLALLSLAFAGAPAFASGVQAAEATGVGVATDPAATALEAKVREIEHLAITEHWRVSNAKIEALAPQDGALTAGQRQRIDYVRLRNLALAGDQPGALQGLAELLGEDLPAPPRVRGYCMAFRRVAHSSASPPALR